MTLNKPPLYDGFTRFLQSISIHFPTLTFITFAILSFYFQLASTVALYSLGINLPFVSIYPLRHKDTLFNALYVNLLLFILTTPATYHFFLLLFHQLFQHTSLNTLLQPISQSNTLHFLLPILPITFLVLLFASFLSILSLSWYHFKRSTPQDSIIITIADRIEEEMKEDALKRCQKEWDLLDSLIQIGRAHV